MWHIPGAIPENLSAGAALSQEPLLYRSNCRRSNFRRSNCRRSNIIIGGAIVGWAIVAEQISTEQLSYLRSICRRSNCRRSNFRRSNCRRGTCRRSKCRRSNCRRSKCGRSNCRRSKCRRSKCLGAFVAEHLSHFSEQLSAEHMSPEHMSWNRIHAIVREHLALAVQHGAKCSLTMAWIHLQKKGSEGVFVECYCDKALCTITIWHSNIYWNDNVYWMVIDKWCHNKNLGFVGVSMYSEEKLQKKYNKIYGTYLNNKSTQVNMHNLHWAYFIKTSVK